MKVVVVTMDLAKRILAMLDAEAPEAMELIEQIQKPKDERAIHLGVVAHAIEEFNKC